MLTLLLIVSAFAFLFATWRLYSRDLIVRAAVLLWIGFIPYEIWFRANCAGECNIRADLVLLLPPLLLISITAVVSVVHKALRRRKAHRAGG
jgi:hypothetical protein